MNILIIESSRTLARTYKLALEADGHTVVSAHGAQEAIVLLDTSPKPPDLLIMELQLVGHYGVEFLYELRSYAEWQNIPIIVNSLIPSHVLDRMAEQLKNLGVKQYFYKPSTSLKKLRSAVSGLVQEPA